MQQATSSAVKGVSLNPPLKSLLITACSTEPFDSAPVNGGVVGLHFVVTGDRKSLHTH